MKLTENRKVQLISLIILVLIFIFLSIQTFSRAYRTDGYDLTSYLLSSKALWEGSDPYNTGSPFPYIYPLFLTVIIAPLAYAPYWLVNGIFLLLNISGLAAIYFLMISMFSREKIKPAVHFIPMLVLTIILFDIIQNNLLNGQINIIVLFLTVLFLYFYQKKKKYLSSALLAAAISIKLTPLIFFIFLIKRRRFIETGITLFFLIVFVFLLPYLVTGSDTIDYYNFYLNKIGTLTSGYVDELTIFSKIFTLHGFISFIIPSLQNSFIFKFISALIVITVIWLMDKDWKNNNYSSDTLFFTIYSTAILLINPMAETHHIIIIFPAMIIIAYKIFLEKHFNKTQTILIIVFIIFFIFGTIIKIGPFYFLTFAILIATLYYIYPNDIYDHQTKNS